MLHPLPAQHLHPTDPLHHDTRELLPSGLSVSTAWDSRYVQEGRNTLEKGGLGSVLLEWNDHLEVGEIVLSGWYAEGIEVNHSEINLGAAYVAPLDPVDMTLVYIWKDFLDEETNENEFSVELGGTIMDKIDLTAAFKYLVETEGTFVELIASTDLERNAFTLTPYILLALNQGLIEEHHGLNNLQFGLEISTPLSDSAELGGYLAYTMGLDEKPGETLEDIFWMGISIRFGK